MSTINFACRSSSRLCAGAGDLFRRGRPLLQNPFRNLFNQPARDQRVVRRGPNIPHDAVKVGGDDQGKVRRHKGIQSARRNDQGGRTKQQFGRDRPDGNLDFDMRRLRLACCRGRWFASFRATGCSRLDSQHRRLFRDRRLGVGLRQQRYDEQVNPQRSFDTLVRCQSYVNRGNCASTHEQWPQRLKPRRFCSGYGILRLRSGQAYKSVPLTQNRIFQHPLQLRAIALATSAQVACSASPNCAHGAAPTSSTGITSVTLVPRPGRLTISTSAWLPYRTSMRSRTLRIPIPPCLSPYALPMPASTDSFAAAVISLIGSVSIPMPSSSTSSSSRPSESIRLRSVTVPPPIRGSSPCLMEFS